MDLVFLILGIAVGLVGAIAAGAGWDTDAERVRSWGLVILGFSLVVIGLTLLVIVAARGSN